MAKTEVPKRCILRKALVQHAIARGLGPWRKSHAEKCYILHTRLIENIFGFIFCTRKWRASPSSVQLYFFCIWPFCTKNHLPPPDILQLAPEMYFATIEISFVRGIFFFIAHFFSFKLSGRSVATRYFPSRPRFLHSFSNAKRVHSWNSPAIVADLPHAILKHLNSGYCSKNMAHSIMFWRDAYGKKVLIGPQNIRIPSGVWG